MRGIFKGIASYIGSGFWWLTQQLYGDAIFQWLQPKIPTAVAHPTPVWLLVSFGPVIALALLGTYFFLRPNRVAVGPTDWPVDRVVEHLVARSMWGQHTLLRLNYVEAVRHQAPVEFRRAATDGEIIVSGRPPNTLESTPIDRNYWRHATLRNDFSGTDVFDHGSIFPPLVCYSDLTVQGETVATTWPTVSWFTAGIYSALVWLKVKWILSPIRERLMKPAVLLTAGTVIGGVLLFACGMAFQNWRMSDGRPVQVGGGDNVRSFEPPSVTVPLAQTPPVIPAVVYTERDIRELLDALAEAHDLLEKKFAPTIYAITNSTANWRGVIPNMGVKGYAIQLKAMRERLQTDLWHPLNEFVYETHARYKDQLRTALDLDHDAVKGELTRSLQIAIEALQRLPENPTEDTRELVAPQFAEAYKQSELLYNWLSEARARIPAVSENLRTKGRTGYENSERDLGSANGQQ